MEPTDVSRRCLSQRMLLVHCVFTLHKRCQRLDACLCRQCSLLSWHPSITKLRLAIHIKLYTVNRKINYRVFLSYHEQCFLVTETLKRHILWWICVVWGTCICRENPSTRFCCRWRQEKKARNSARLIDQRGSHMHLDHSCTPFTIHVRRLLPIILATLNMVLWLKAVTMI